MISGVSSKNSEQKHGFLQFSQKLDYGLFLLTELAKRTDQEPVSLRTVAQEHQMSFFFLQKVAFDLRKAELIRADRGKNGGYVLVKKAENITLKEIIEVLEGPVSVMHCLIAENLQHSQCSRSSKCHMRRGLSAVNQAVVNIFQQTTLLHLLQQTWNQAA